MKFVYRTEGTCCQAFEIEVDDNRRIQNVNFFGGCNGNLQGICSLIKGMDAGEVVDRLQGIRCGAKSTSCPDQLCKALRQHVLEETK